MFRELIIFVLIESYGKLTAVDQGIRKRATPYANSPQARRHEKDNIRPKYGVPLYAKSAWLLVCSPSSDPAKKPVSFPFKY